MANGSTRSFRSAVDWWYYLLIAGIAVVLLFSALTAGEKPSITAIGMGVILGLGLPIWLVFSTFYVVDESQLEVRSGPFRWHIPLKDIHAIKRSRSLVSSPALSLNRLEISYGQGRTLLVSPVDREGFARALGVELNDGSSET